MCACVGRPFDGGFSMNSIKDKMELAERGTIVFLKRSKIWFFNSFGLRIYEHTAPCSCPRPIDCIQDPDPLQASGWDMTLADVVQGDQTVERPLRRFPIHKHQLTECKLKPRVNVRFCPTQELLHSLSCMSNSYSNSCSNCPRKISWAWIAVVQSYVHVQVVLRHSHDRLAKHCNWNRFC